MRKYNKNTNELEAAVCNCCGKSMKIQNGMLLEGICSVLFMYLIKQFVPIFSQHPYLHFLIFAS